MHVNISSSCLFVSLDVTDRVQQKNTKKRIFLDFGQARRENELSIRSFCAAISCQCRGARGPVWDWGSRSASIVRMTRMSASSLISTPRSASCPGRRSAASPRPTRASTSIWSETAATSCSRSGWWHYLYLLFILSVLIFYPTRRLIFIINKPSCCRVQF